MDHHTNSSTHHPFYRRISCDELQFDGYYNHHPCARFPPCSILAWDNGYCRIYYSSSSPYSSFFSISYPPSTSP